jgi:hypothetical protein
MLRCVEICKCDSWSVPARAKMRGTYSVGAEGWSACSMVGVGREGMRQERGASLWM